MGTYSGDGSIKYHRHFLSPPRSGSRQVNAGVRPHFFVLSSGPEFMLGAAHVYSGVPSSVNALQKLPYRCACPFVSTVMLNLIQLTGESPSQLFWAGSGSSSESPAQS